MKTKRFSSLLIYAVCAILVVCFATAMFLAGEHIGEDHDQDCCPLCAVLGLVAAVCVVAFCATCATVRFAQPKTTATTPRQSFVLSCVRLNC